MIKDKILLLEKLDRLEELLAEFNELSGGLSAADLEIVEEADELLAAREKLIVQMKTLTPEVAEIVGRQSPEKTTILGKMLNGEAVMAEFTEDEKELQSKIINIRSLQSDILKSDESNRMRFKRKYDEVREELENLQKEKKKLNFYQTAATSERVSKFENQG